MEPNAAGAHELAGGRQWQTAEGQVCGRSAAAPPGIVDLLREAALRRPRPRGCRRFPCVWGFCSMSVTAKVPAGRHKSAGLGKEPSTHSRQGRRGTVQGRREGPSTWLCRASRGTGPARAVVGVRQGGDAEEHTRVFWAAGQPRPWSQRASTGPSGHVGVLSSDKSNLVEDTRLGGDAGHQCSSAWVSDAEGLRATPAGQPSEVLYLVGLKGQRHLPRASPAHPRSLCEQKAQERTGSSSAAAQQLLGGRPHDLLGRQL